MVELPAVVESRLGVAVDVDLPDETVFGFEGRGRLLPG
jgi:hypothetical protein